MRDYIDVIDLSSAIIKLIESNVSNKVLNLASGIGVSVNEIIHLVKKKINKKPEVQYKDKRSVDADKIVLSITEIKNHIEFYPKKLTEGIDAFLRYIEDEK